MMRALTPKKQAELLTEFMTQCGASAAHTQVLELVARLNGAPNWNALQKPRAPAQENAFSKAVKVMLAPWAKRLNIEAELKAFRPTREPSSPARVLNGLYQAMVQQHQEPGKEAWKGAQEALKLAREASIDVEDLVWKTMGFNRVLPAPQGCDTYTLKTEMFDEESGWKIELDGDLVDVPDDLLDELLEKAVVAVATVEFPRGDKYGVPHEATDEGMRDWLWEFGFAVIPDLYVEGSDRGDDGMMSCEIGVYLPAELVEKIRLAKPE